MNNKKEINLTFKEISKGNRKVFEKIYSDYYKKLCDFLMGYTNDTSIIEDVVQDVFFKIWINRKKTEITTSLNNYLYRAAYNTLMENYRQLKRNNNMLSTYYYTALIQSSETNQDFKSTQLKNLENCIENLPERCKQVLIENKLSGLKYSEVAQKLNISIKTVEGHISRALGSLRDCMY